MKKLLSFYLLMLCAMAMYAQPQLLEQTLMHDGLERRYLLYVPEAYDGSEAWPVMLNFHELNSVPEDAIATTRMNEVADTAHFLVVYPEAVVVPNFGVPGVTSDSLELWNDGFLPDIGIDDVGFTNTLIDVLATDYQVDLTRVYATGFGSGGGMVGRLACELNHRIAAIADMEGFIGCIPDNPIPTLIMFGTADPFVPYEGGGLFPPVRGFVDNWAAANGCSDMPTETEFPDVNTADSSTVTLLTYNDCAAGGETTFYRINNGGRSHPGADPMDYPPEILAQIGNINQDINASSEIWNFLKQFDRPQPQLLEQTITVDGLEREYLLYVPAAYDGSEAWPLVLNFHGATSNPAEQAFVTGMNATADTANFLIAYPAGISNPEMTDTGWNDPMLPELQDDVKFTSHLIDVISNEYNIDPARIYAAGTSNGGGMVYTLACELADRIAAFASVTGPSLLDCDPGRPVPILQMHGTADLIVPFNGGMGIFVPREFPAVRDRISYWADKNGCVGEPEITEFPDINTADSSTVTLERYNNCEGNAEIAFYVVDNGGHTWPGGAPIPLPLEGFFGNVNRDINASSEIWNFFNRHVHPNPAVPQLLERTITVDGIERRYLVYVPGTYKGNEDWPLVLNLHGYLDNPEAQIFISQMNIVADTAEFIIAYPAGELVSLADIEGLPPFIPPQGPGWNLGGDISENDDLGFLVQMIDSIANEFAINESRIYSTGLSMGGITSYMLACAYPDRIAAIAPVAANLLPEEGQIDFSCNPTSPVPVLHIHGTNDIIDPFEPSIVFRGAISSVNFWRDQNGCSNTPVETMFPDIDTEDGSTVTSIKYNDCESDSEVWLYRIDDGGHNWPGGAPLRPGFDILGPVNRDINASSEIWNFFNRYELSESTSIKTVTPATFNLRVFPNPASTQVTFSFALPQSARVQLTLHNAIGQRVQTLHDGQLPQGEQQFTWQRDGLPQGTYFYRLRVNDQITSAPVILVR